MSSTSGFRRLHVSRAGVGVAAGAVLCYAAGVLLGYPLLLTVAAGAFAMLVLAVAFVAVRPAVSLARQVSPARVTVGEMATGRLDLRNISRWPAPAFTAVDLVGGDPIELPVPPLPGRAERTVP